VPAPQRVSIERIREALKASDGNITAAAKVLDMARNNLYERIERAAIDLEVFRPQPGSHVSLRVKAESSEKLRQASFDLAFLRRHEVTPAQVLEEFLEDAFDPWLASKKAKP